MEARAHIPVQPPHPSPLPSYWQTPPSSLSNHTSTSQSTSAEPYDTIIIGSGISGTLLAHFLLSPPSASPSSPSPTTSQPTPPKILLLESRTLCSGATGRNGGHTKAASYRSYLSHTLSLGTPEALKIARLEHSNILATHALARTLGIERECESEVCGTLDVVYDRRTFEEGVRAIEMLRGDVKEEEKGTGGMGKYEVFEGWEEVRRGDWGVVERNAVEGGEQVAGAFKYLAGRIHAYRFTTGILARCVEKGLQVQINALVTSLRKDEDTGLWDVYTPTGTWKTKNVVLATNGYTANLLLEMQGKIVPMRGQITAQRPGSGNTLCTPLENTYSFIYRDGYEYMIPRPLANGGQHIIIGGGLGRLADGGIHEYGTVDDGVLNPDISRYLRGSLLGYFGKENWGEKSEEEKQRVVQEWTGIMGATADGRPFVGEVPGKKGMWISAGFNGHGMVLCLKSAEALVQMIRAGGSKGRPEWFPESFLITEERLEKCHFRGRTDLQSSE